MVRKCRGIAEIAVMEMTQAGARTRARAALAMGATTSSGRTTKRRKINKEELKFSPSSIVQLKSRSRDAAQPETTFPPAAQTEERCSSPSSDEFPASCCSRNGSIELDEERIKFVDLEVESALVETSTCNCGDESRKMSPSTKPQTNSEDLELTEKPVEGNSLSTSTVQKMPTQSELDEFFAAAEQDIQKRFAEKYNYDIAKDEPLEGRYEWVQLKP